MILNFVLRFSLIHIFLVFLSFKLSVFFCKFVMVAIISDCCFYCNDCLVGMRTFLIPGFYVCECPKGVN